MPINLKNLDRFQTTMSWMHVPSHSKEKLISKLIMEYGVIIHPNAYDLEMGRQEERIVDVETKLLNLNKMLQRQYSGLMKRELYDYCTLRILELYANMLIRTMDGEYKFPKLVERLIGRVSSTKINYHRARLLEMHPMHKIRVGHRSR